MKSDWFEPIAQRHRDMEARRIISWSPSLQRWCVCDGFAKVIATARTREEAEALKHYKPPEQLRLF